MRGGLNRVDHRPTKLLVSGHEGDEWEEVLVHFAVSRLNSSPVIVTPTGSYFAAIW